MFHVLVSVLSRKFSELSSSRAYTAQQIPKVKEYCWRISGYKARDPSGTLDSESVLNLNYRFDQRTGHGHEQPGKNRGHGEPVRAIDEINPRKCQRVPQAEFQQHSFRDPGAGGPKQRLNDLM